MRFYPTKIRFEFVCFIFLSIFIILGCSKDSDLLLDAVFDDTVASVDQKENTPEAEAQDETSEEEVTEEQGNEEEQQPNLVSRTSSFSPTNDAHVQSGKGYNQDIIRLEEGHRTSYLMFDLSPIADIEGEITSASLQFTIDSDDGSGSIDVFKGKSNNWTETDISDITAPEIDVKLGGIIKDYNIGVTEIVQLDTTNMIPEISTLILEHKDGNDLAFASKEHISKLGPKLVITYEVVEGANEIVIEEETEEETEEESPEDSTPQNEEPIAVADASPAAGQAPLEVTFQGNNSSDDVKIVSYTWDFKDGSSSDAPNPIHTFNSVGSYSVELTVVDDEGLSSTDTVTITVSDEKNEAPKAVATATPLSGEAPLEVTFKGSESTDDNFVKTYSWDFNDGTTKNMADLQHTYESAGEYQAKLTVTDENGLSNTSSITITVTESNNEAPVAVANANPKSGIAPLNVQFFGDYSTDDKEIESYFWDFKDGSTTSNKNPSHEFTQSGTYEVELTVKDAEGLTNTKKVTIVASEPEANEAPVARATADRTSGDSPLEVQFTGSTSSDDKQIVSYYWDFKDGSTATNNNPSHTFNSSGVYQVELTVTDEEGLSNTDSITITAESSSSGNNGGSNNYPSNAVFASSFGFNSSDATAAFEAALKSGSSFVVVDKQNSDWIIRPTKFFDLRDMTIIFEEGVVLRAKSGAFSDDNDQLVQLFRPRNVVIEGYGATFKMLKNEYTFGEHRHALTIKKANGLTIRGLTFKDSGGDGIIIAGIEQGSYSQNVTIEDVTCSNNRRQGMSIISAQNVFVRNSQFLNTSGIDPETGVDLEPNYSNERLVNINFTNCKFAGNDSNGFLLATTKLNSSSIPISVKISDSEFSYNTKSPSSGQIRTEIRLSQGATSNPVKGEIRFERINFNGSNRRILFSKKSDDAYKVVFKDCIAKNVSNQGINPVIGLEALSTVTTLGGFTFDNFRIEYTKNVPFMEINAPRSNFTVKNISGDFIIKEPYDNTLKYSGGYNPSNNQNVSINYTHIN